MPDRPPSPGPLPPLGSFVGDVLYALGRSAVRAVDQGIESVLNDLDATADDFKRRVARVRTKRRKKAETR